MNAGQQATRHIYITSFLPRDAAMLAWYWES